MLFPRSCIEVPEMLIVALKSSIVGTECDQDGVLARGMVTRTQDGSCAEHSTSAAMVGEVLIRDVEKEAHWTSLRFVQHRSPTGICITSEIDKGLLFLSGSECSAQ